MTKEKSLAYKKAYVELYELIKLLTKQEQEKIPNDFIEYINHPMKVEELHEIDGLITDIENLPQNIIPYVKNVIEDIRLGIQYDYGVFTNLTAKKKR